MIRGCLVRTRNSYIEQVGAPWALMLRDDPPISTTDLVMSSCPKELMRWGGSHCVLVEPSRQLQGPSSHFPCDTSFLKVLAAARLPVLARKITWRRKHSDSNNDWFVELTP